MKKMRKDNGVTITMLTVSVIVMLVIASILTYVSMNNQNLMDNAQNTKFKETMSDLRSQVKQKIIMKQEIAGKEDITLTEDEHREILGSYFPNQLVVRNQDLCYKTNSGFSPDEKDILADLGIQAVDN